MSDEPYSNKRPAQQPGSKNVTPTGPHGGGTKYVQMPRPDGAFKSVPPIAGHTQKGNIKGTK